MMQKQQGLAAMQPQQENSSNVGEIEQLVQEIVKLLQQGVSPEELIKQGIPAELVQEAVKIMQSSEKTTSATSGQGLAALQI